MSKVPAILNVTEQEVQSMLAAQVFNPAPQDLLLAFVLISDRYCLVPLGYQELGQADGSLRVEAS